MVINVIDFTFNILIKDIRIIFLLLVTHEFIYIYIYIYIYIFEKDEIIKLIK